MGGVNNAAQWVVEYLYGMSPSEWLRLLIAIVGGGIWLLGLWGAIRYSKGQIAKRFTEYLDRKEENILSARKELLQQLEFARSVEQVAIHRTLEEAFSLLHSARQLEALVHLDAFKRVLLKSADLGERHRNLANQQAATVLLFMGIIARHRHQLAEAQRHWKTALDLYKTDAEVMRRLAELEEIQGDRRQARSLLGRALANAGNDDELRADILLDRARIHSSNQNPRLERDDLRHCAPLFIQQRRWRKGARAFARLGELCSNHGPLDLVEHSYLQALNAYEHAGDAGGVERMRASLKLPPPPREEDYPLGKELLAWLKLWFELTILFWAICMFMSPA